MHPIDSGYRTQLIQEDLHREATMARRHSDGSTAEPKHRAWSVRLTWPNRQRRATAISSPSMDC